MFAAVVLLPDASRALAETTCESLLAVVLFHVTEYGAVVSSLPRLAPSSRNWTPATAALSDAVAATATEVPATVALFAGADIETVGAVVSAPAVTVSAKEVLRTLPPAIAVIVIVDVVVGVDAAVEMVTVVEHVGEQDELEKVASAPAGSPDALKVTARVDPETSVAVTGFDTDAPRITDRLPPLASEMSNDDAATVDDRMWVVRMAKISDARSPRDARAPLRSRRCTCPPNEVVTTGPLRWGEPQSRDRLQEGLPTLYRCIPLVRARPRTDALELGHRAAPAAPRWPFDSTRFFRRARRDQARDPRAARRRAGGEAARRGGARRRPGPWRHPPRNDEKTREAPILGPT